MDNVSLGRMIEVRSLTLPQKAVAAVIAIGSLGLYVALLPAIIGVLQMTWTVVTLGVGLIPIVLVALFMIQNPYFIMSQFAILSKAITRRSIWHNPVGNLEAHLDYLKGELVEIGNGCEKIQSFFVERERKLDGVKRDFQKTLSSASSGDDKLKTALAPKLASLESQQTTLTRQVESMRERRDFMFQTRDNYRKLAENLEMQIEVKVDEWESCKEEARIAGMTSKFMTGETESSKLFKESLKALEAQTSQFIATVDTFKFTSEHQLTEMSNEEKIKQQEGLALIAAYVEENK